MQHYMDILRTKEERTSAMPIERYTTEEEIAQAKQIKDTIDILNSLLEKMHSRSGATIVLEVNEYGGYNTIQVKITKRL